MKKLLLDELLVLVICILMIVGIPLLYGPRLSTILIFAIGMSAVVICKEVILFPIDLMLGKKTVICYYSTYDSWVHEYEFFHRERCDRWKFYDNNRSFWLTVPLKTLKRYQTYEQVCPPERKKLRVTFYRLSHVLLSWEIVS